METITRHNGPTFKPAGLVRDFSDGDRAEEMKSAGPSSDVPNVKISLDEDIGETGAAIEEVKGVQA